MVAALDARANGVQIWDVISDEGSRVLQVSVPDTFVVHTARGTRVWGVHYDEYDVPRLSTMMVRAAVPG